MLYNFPAPSLRSLSTTGRLFEPQDAYTAAQSNTGGNSSESLLATLNKIKRTSPGVKTKEGPGAAFTAPESPRDVPSSSVSSAPTSAPATSSSSSSSSSAPPASSAPSTTSEVQSTTESTTSTDKFSNLKGKINGALYKALTQRPFNFEKMSSVQEAVLNLLPELAVEAPKNREGGEEAQAINKARQDLLVKAKTGTGKTIAFLVPALEARFNDIEQERQRFMGEHPK